MCISLSMYIYIYIYMYIGRSDDQGGLGYIFRITPIDIISMQLNTINRTVSITNIIITDIISMQITLVIIVLTVLYES